MTAFATEGGAPLVPHSPTPLTPIGLKGFGVIVSPKTIGGMRFVSQFRFSPSGVFEQDDMDNWIQVTGAAKSLIGRRHPANYQMSGNEPPLETDLPGTVASRFSDNNQLSLYMDFRLL